MATNKNKNSKVSLILSCYNETIYVHFSDKIFNNLLWCYVPQECLTRKNVIFQLLIVESLIAVSFQELLLLLGCKKHFNP